VTATTGRPFAATMYGISSTVRCQSLSLRLSVPTRLWSDDAHHGLVSSSQFFVFAVLELCTARDITNGEHFVACCVHSHPAWGGYGHRRGYARRGGHVVPLGRETFLDATQLALWASLDGPVRYDGLCGTLMGECEGCLGCGSLPWIVCPVLRTVCR
jgi:hypothetical protein